MPKKNEQKLRNTQEKISKNEEKMKKTYAKN